MKCPTCGQPKKYHSSHLWEAHLNMHKAAREQRKLLQQQLKGNKK